MRAATRSCLVLAEARKAGQRSSNPPNAGCEEWFYRQITGPRRANRSSSARLLPHEITGPRRANKSSSARLLPHEIIEIIGPRRANMPSSARLLPHEITGPRRANRSSSTRLLPQEITSPRYYVLVGSKAGARLVNPMTPPTSSTID
jgi:hypothetical protein